MIRCLLWIFRYVLWGWGQPKKSTPIPDDVPEWVKSLSKSPGWVEKLRHLACNEPSWLLQAYGKSARDARQKCPHCFPPVETKIGRDVLGRGVKLHPQHGYPLYMAPWEVLEHLEWFASRYLSQSQSEIGTEFDWVLRQHLRALKIKIYGSDWQHQLTPHQKANQQVHMEKAELIRREQLDDKHSRDEDEPDPWTIPESLEYISPPEEVPVYSTEQVQAFHMPSADIDYLGDFADSVRQRVLGYFAVICTNGAQSIIRNNPLTSISLLEWLSDNGYSLTAGGDNFVQCQGFSHSELIDAAKHLDHTITTRRQTI